MSKFTDNLSYSHLLKILDYNSETGEFIWKIQLSGKGKVGTLAGTILPAGYRQIKIDTIAFLAHRLAWFYVYGIWPKQLDHSDGDRDNNSIRNLRLATPQQNSANKKLQINNSSGFKGVRIRPNKAGNMRWRAVIETKGKNITIGTFATGEEASAAYLEIAKNYHGEFARRE